MSTVVQELLQDHAHLTSSLLKVQRADIQTEEGRNLLVQVKKSLLAHLAKEDADLYPVLWKAAETDEKLKGTMEQYAKDMDQISASAIAFFEKYCSLQGNKEDFEKDCRGLIRAICKRMGNEEAVLYKKFDEIVR